MHFSILDEQIYCTIEKSALEIEKSLSCNLVYFYGQIVPDITRPFIRLIETICNDKKYKKDTIAICLTTPGGSVEAVEVMVRALRKHYKNIYFIIAQQAMSAGTIFCMSGDKIYMDYSSSLGPIDPQIMNREGQFVPALGYLDKVNELVQKSADGTMTQAEYGILASQDIAFLRLCEQARDLSTSLLQEWLVKYKFKNWKQHRTTNPGTNVTKSQKENRAVEIASMLADNKKWHMHGRYIGIDTLRQELKLEIEDFSEDEDLRKHIRIYSDMLYDYYQRNGTGFALHNSKMVE
tara:strand:+ start:1508 stop:2386 length:879 start_codon:yes stop_codon:yes gene_type:complete